MTRNVHKLLAGLILGVFATGAVAEQTGADDFAARVNEQLGLLDSVVFQMDVDTTPGQPVIASIPVRGDRHELMLAPHSVRAESYQVLAQRADGSYEKIEPGPVRTLRGMLSGFFGSVVAGSMNEDGLTARIALPDGEVLWLEPIGDRVAGATPRDYVLYVGDDVIRPEGYCGVDELVNAGDEWLPGPDRGGPGRGTDICVADLACDADVEYFNRWGSVATVESQINNVINGVNVQYEAEVGITHAITTIIVRTAEPDPYTSTDAGTLLDQFRAEWIANQGGIVRDVAQLFSGKNLDGGVIGVAWLSSVCTNLRYSVVQHISGLSCRTDLSAHELGHNWGAGHCNCPNNTMNPSLTCSNTFSQGSRNAITSFRDTRNCIDCNATDPPQISVVGVPGTGANLATADVSVITDPDDWWTIGGVSSEAAGLGAIAPGIEILFQPDPNTGARMTNVGGGGNPGNPVTFVSLPRDQFVNQRFGANGAAVIVGAYEPTGSTGVLDGSAVNIGFIQFPPSVDGTDVPNLGYVTRVTLDLSNSAYAGADVEVSTTGAPAGHPNLIGEFQVAMASKEYSSPLTVLTFGFYATDPVTTCPGDLNGDGEIDLSDLSIVLSNYGTLSGAGPEDGDLDGNGTVDLADLAIFLPLFGTSCP